MSHIGEQLCAPNGFSCLISTRSYHYLGRCHGGQKIILVFFSENPAKANVELMSCEDFEYGLETEAIVSEEMQKTFPPWLSHLEGVDPLSLDEGKSSDREMNYEEEVDKRYSQIEPLLDREKEIFLSNNPVRTINQYVRQQDRSLNETRLRTWFFSYLCFGRSKWALLRSYKNNGKWKRSTISPMVKLGRPSKYKGRQSGYTVTDGMREKIFEGYRKHKKRGRHLSVIYGEALRHIFKCRIRTVENEKKEFFQPKGEPFPSMGQFRYWVHKEYGLRNVQIELYGETRVRNKLSESKGKFTESVANLLEHIEGDGYYAKEVPRGPVGGEPMPPLCIVRLRDSLSGEIVGIGFSVGSEKAEAYKMALFCMAISKIKFCEMFGISISIDQWPSVGLPSWIDLDRGPGAVKELIEEVEHRIPISGLSPSYEGQAKAIIESSHPREVKQYGKPHFFQSDLTYVEIARKEIERTLRDNASSDVSSRLTPNLIKEIKIHNPISLWNYFDKRLRTDAHPIPFDAAVRNLLPKVEFSARKDGVYLEEQRFDSSELRDAGVCGRVVSNGVYGIKGYVMPLSLRQAWIDVDGRLIDVNALLPIRDNEEQLYISLYELRVLKKIRDEIAANSKENRIAVEAEHRERFESDTGKSWDAGSFKSGRAKRGTVAARNEFSDVKRMMTGGKLK